MLGRASDEDVFRLVVAFCCVMEPEQRARIIDLAENLASRSQVVEGHVHFLLLDRDLALENDDEPACSPGSG